MSLSKPQQSEDSTCWLMTHCSLFRLESLLPLAALAHLHTLSLKLPGSKLTNPVCCDPGYDSFLKETFPHLVWLDMEKVAGAGAEFYSRCRELDRQLENGRKEEGERETRRQGITSFYWVVVTSRFVRSTNIPQ